MCSNEGREGKRVASPKEYPLWVKHNIYNMRSKVAADKDQVSTGGLASDKVPKITLGRRSHIAIAKPQLEVEMKNGKQETIGRALRARLRPKTGSTDACPFIHCTRVGELPKIRISQKNDQHSKNIHHFYSRNYDGGRKI